MNYKGREVPDSEIKERLATLEELINVKLLGAKALTINGVNIHGSMFNVKLAFAASLWPMAEGEDIIMEVRSGEKVVCDLIFKAYEKLNCYTWKLPMRPDGKDQVTINVDAIDKRGR